MNKIMISKKQKPLNFFSRLPTHINNHLFSFLSYEELIILFKKFDFLRDFLDNKIISLGEQFFNYLVGKILSNVASFKHDQLILNEIKIISYSSLVKKEWNEFWMQFFLFYGVFIS